MKTDGKTARIFVIRFRMYLQTKQSITQANTPTDRKLTLNEIDNKLGVSDLTEWIPPFPCALKLYPFFAFAVVVQALHSLY